MSTCIHHRPPPKVKKTSLTLSKPKLCRSCTATKTRHISVEYQVISAAGCSNCKISYFIPLYNNKGNPNMTASLWSHSHLWVSSGETRTGGGGADLDQERGVGGLFQRQPGVNVAPLGRL